MKRIVIYLPLGTSLAWDFQPEGGGRYSRRTPDELLVLLKNQVTNSPDEEFSFKVLSRRGNNIEEVCIVKCPSKEMALKGVEEILKKGEELVQATLAIKALNNAFSGQRQPQLKKLL